jgi:hypothetical protein
MATGTVNRTNTVQGGNHMHQKILRSAFGMLLAGALALTVVGCATDPDIPEHLPTALGISIIAGPDSTLAVAHGSKVTFKWQPVGGSGAYTFKYKIDSGTEVAVTAGQTSIILSDVAILTTGIHKLTVTVTDANDATKTKLDERMFVIGAPGTGDTAAPTIEVTYPPVGYVTAPGSWVRFEWTVSDLSNATEAGVVAGVDSVGWAVDDANPVVDANILLTGGVADVTLGTHTLYVKAVDASGNSTVLSYDFDVIAPTVFIVDETVDGPGYSAGNTSLTSGGEFQRDQFRAKMFDGYSYTVWDVVEQGAFPITTDIPASAQALVWFGSGDVQNSSWGWNVGYEYSYQYNPNIITEAVDNGLKVWIMGENWLEEIGWSGQALDSTIEYDYLGFPLDSATTGVYWVEEDVNATIFDLESADDVTGISWPGLASDIAKLDAGLGDFGNWSADAITMLRSDVTPIYKVKNMSDGSAATPAAQDDWYIAWSVDDSAGDPQVVMMTFDLYYFSQSNAVTVANNIMTELFNQ